MENWSNQHNPHEQGQRTKNKLNTHETPGPGIKSGPGSKRRGPLPLCHPCFLKSNGYEEADVLGPELLIHLIFLLCLQLKKSHIRPPIPEEREFSTTHQRTYTPKKTSRRSVNSGSLQRSSIPLGTLNTYV